MKHIRGDGHRAGDARSDASSPHYTGRRPHMVEVCFLEIEPVSATRNPQRELERAIVD